MVLQEPKHVKVSDVPCVDIDMGQGVCVRVLFSSSEAPTYAMRVFEMDVGGHIDAHKHPWEHEIFVLEGRIRVRVGNRSYVLEPGSALYIPPNVEHEYWNEFQGKSRFICVIPVKPTVQG